jgi:hypothetical protein
MVNIMAKRCENNECNTRASFNYEFEKKSIYCFKHKLDNMININCNRCENLDCNKQAHYNYNFEKKSIYCSKHKLDNMVNIRSTRCKSTFCDIFVNKKNDGYCLPCYINLFPDKPKSRNYKTKERQVTDFILQNFNNLTIIIDKKIQNGCSSRRPDILIDLGFQILIIEIDENQHINYDCSCENKRIMQLSQDVNHRPIIFIRFNPDDYKDKNNKNITSCFGINGNSGILTIKKSKQKEWCERLNTLKNIINYWIDPTNITNKTVEIIQLFYDNF